MKTKKIVIIHIDSSKIHETTVLLQIGQEKKKKIFVSDDHTAQHVLPLIESVLRENQIVFEDITAIEAHPGPGSFTGLRVGAVIGNTLGWLLNIPVNGKQTVSHLDYGNDSWR